jgi:3-methylcrotonyl-CoA carboxylase alpha subunit
VATVNKLLVANRGEIACRIMRTCRRLGIATVAVYSSADADARHVRHADEAWPIGDAAPSASYLDIDRLLEAARLSGADAIHPGYGFLAENADFARAVREAGITFVGPAADTIALMGSKAASRQRMREAGVPVLPGYDGDEQGDEHLAREADRIGYPVLIKASAGGGGKGMRVVGAADAFTEAAASARREALSAFGDDRLIVEKYLIEPRHIEVQVIGDDAGKVLHLFERECSVQRRHQKIIEESPSPFLDTALREAITGAAVEAARAVNYRNAGTVEFIVDRERRFYFMEMNTRLQVEHPVTEMICGIDLVELQLQVAAGNALTLEQHALTSHGHAIECRLYAERPEQGFLPSTGRIEVFAHPDESERTRIDSGVDEGDRVTIYYDPMIAKLITHGADRHASIAAMRRLLARTTVVGVGTNIALLGELLADRRFHAGEVDTTFVDRELETLVAGSMQVDDAQLVAAAVRCAADAAAGTPGGEVDQRPSIAQAGGSSAPDHAPVSPWAARDHWRASALQRRRFRFATRDGRSVVALVRGMPGEVAVTLEDGQGARSMTVAVNGQLHRSRFALIIDGTRHTVEARRFGHRLLVQVDERVTELQQLSAFEVATTVADEDIHPTAPMPGRVVNVAVEAGSAVAEGDALLTLEGMKMEYTVRARRAGVVEAVHCTVGDMVDADVALVSLQEVPE